MRVKRLDVLEKDGHTRIDIVFSFEKSIMISPIQPQLEILRGYWDSDLDFLKGDKKNNALHLETEIKSIDQIPQLESELKEIIARCQIAESERIKQDRLLYEKVKTILDKILSPYAEQEDKEDDDDC